MTIRLEVTGMSCQNCVRHAREALLGVEGVSSAEVTLEPGAAVVEGSAEVEALIAALDEEGYCASLAP
jgi:copper chaperone